MYLASSAADGGAESVEPFWRGLTGPGAEIAEKMVMKCRLTAWNERLADPLSKS